MLIIDTSGGGIKLAFGDIIKNIDTEKQTLELPGAVEDFLRENGISFGDLSVIGVIVGPGSFTGIRLGIAYAKGLSIGLNIPIISLTLFDIYLERNPDAFVAIDSKRGDFFVAAHDLEPVIMDIDTLEIEQMKYPKTVGHLPYDLRDAASIAKRKLNNNEPVIPLYMRPSYAEINNAKNKC